MKTEKMKFKRDGEKMRVWTGGTGEYETTPLTLASAVTMARAILRAASSGNQEECDVEILAVERRG